MDMNERRTKEKQLLECAKKVGEILSVQSETYEQSELRQLLDDLLYSRKEIWKGLQLEIITIDEAANLLLAHLTTWFESKGGLQNVNIEQINPELVYKIKATISSKG